VVAVEEKRMSDAAAPRTVPAKVRAFDEIVIGLKKPPAGRAEDREIAAQLRALAETVRAGRDEWVVAAAQKAQRLSALGHQRGFWRL